MRADRGQGDALPGLAGVPDAVVARVERHVVDVLPDRKNTRSPGFIDRLLIFFEAAYCSLAVRGSDLPAWRMTHPVKPEQSKARGPVAP